ncbi:Protein of unknown function [Cotesia congregata]|uniref:Uncharacterized protein n=1 Tax=Cotesia congregata TaxID=51543 RepID=A0A8J2HEL3_COTCN|nr:Protein of unknown function [Cotesia congregata]
MRCGKLDTFSRDCPCPYRKRHKVRHALPKPARDPTGSTTPRNEQCPEKSRAEGGHFQPTALKPDDKRPFVEIRLGNGNPLEPNREQPDRDQPDRENPEPVVDETLGPRRVTRAMAKKAKLASAAGEPG